MAQVKLFSPTNFEAFTYDPENPTYWTEYLSYTLLVNLANMQTAGFVLDDGQTVDDDDVSVLESLVNLVLDAVEGKMEDEAASARGITPDGSRTRFLPAVVAAGSWLLPLVPGIVGLLKKLPLAKILNIAHALYFVLEILCQIKELLKSDTQNIEVTTDFADLIECLQAALMKNDTALLEQAFLTTEDNQSIAWAEKIQIALEGLQYNDEIIQIGPLKIHLKARIVEY